jgi:hypothetical protein
VTAPRERGQRFEPVGDGLVESRRAVEKGDRDLGEKVGQRAAGQPWAQVGEKPIWRRRQDEQRAVRGCAGPRHSSGDGGPGGARQPLHA